MTQRRQFGRVRRLASGRWHARRAGVHRAKGMPMRRPFAARIFKPAVERAGLDPTLTFRGLRKVATTFRVHDGVHPRVIQYRLGHATARLFQELHAKVSDAADEEAAAGLGARFSAATGTMGARKPSSD